MGDGSVVGDQGVYAGLWSSSPLVRYKDTRCFYIDEYVAGPDNFYRMGGYSVRCFKNSNFNEGVDSGSGSASTHVTLTLTA